MGAVGVPVKAGLGLTVYGGDAFKSLPSSLPLIARVDPAFVILHTWPDGRDAELVDAVKKQKATRRVWFSPGANSLADDTPASCAAMGKTWAQRCRAWGAELLLLNIEERSAKGRPGWLVTKGDDKGNALLNARLTALLDAIAAEGVQLGITSHDRCISKPLPTIAYTHPWVSLVLPQVYPSTSTKPDNFKTRAAVKKRLDGTIAQWQAYAYVRDTLRPGGTGWGIYQQLWGQRNSAVAWLADQSDIVCGWELPMLPRGVAQEEALQGMAVIARCRSLYGEGAGSVRRAQKALGLVVDGLPGPLLAGALKLPWSD